MCLINKVISRVRKIVEKDGGKVMEGVWRSGFVLFRVLRDV